MSRLDCPILIQACDDDLGKLQLENRRDAFCGKLSLCNNLWQYGIKYTLTKRHTCPVDSEEFHADVERFAKVCAVVKTLRTARIAQIGARVMPFRTVRYSEKLLAKCRHHRRDGGLQRDHGRHRSHHRRGAHRPEGGGDTRLWQRGRGH